MNLSSMPCNMNNLHFESLKLQYIAQRSPINSRNVCIILNKHNWIRCYNNFCSHSLKEVVILPSQVDVCRVDRCAALWCVMNNGKCGCFVIYSPSKSLHRSRYRFSTFFTND